MSKRAMVLSSILASVVFTGFGMAPAQGDVIEQFITAMPSVDDDPNHWRTNYTGTAGFIFQIGVTDRVVNQIGFYDRNGDGMAADQKVAIWVGTAPGTGTGAMLAEVTVTNASPLDANNFRWVDIAPLTLTAGNWYVLGMPLVAGVSEPFHDTTPVDSTIINSYFGEPSNCWTRYAGWAGDQFQYPLEPAYQGNSGGVIYGGPNFRFVDVPEPTSIALLALGGVMVLARRQK